MHTLDEASCHAELRILDNDNAGVTLQTPTVRIQRVSDGLWADFADNTFSAAPVTPTTVMTEVSVATAPGLYHYEFVRDDWDEEDEEVYLFVYKNTGVYDGDDSDLHRWVEISSVDVVGQYQVIIFVKESTTLDAIVACDVDVWTGIAGAVGAVRYVRKQTDTVGRVVTWLDAGTYRIYLHDPTHTSFTYPESVTVSGNGTVTLYGDAFNAGVSPASTIRIYDWEHYADGATPLVGAGVSAWPTDEGSYKTWGGLGHRSLKVTSTTDADGYWYLDLAHGIDYTFDLEDIRGKVYERITTPTTGASAQLRTLL